jgi:HSP20 family molecular chaperone IbpA
MLGKSFSRNLSFNYIIIEDKNAIIIYNIKDNKLMPKLIEYIGRAEMEKIRREWVEENGKYYFSVVDVIGILTDSTDARNYWKVLKSRLKNSQNKLVTECNQLKMESNDGKFYLTDTLDSEKILELVKIISPEKVAAFKLYFEKQERKRIPSYPHNEIIPDNDAASVAELSVDGFETKDSIIIKTMVAGVPKENILISVSCETLTITGERKKIKNNSEENYSQEELYWGKFSRSITLPSLVDVDEVEATIHYGLVSIKLKKIDRLLTKKIEIKIV